MGTHRTDHDRSITPAGFARLLARLGSDADRAASEYERLRRALVKFFDWRGVWPADECADEVLDRLTRKLEETSVEDVRHYALGIARLVLLERRRYPVLTSIDDVTELSRVEAAALSAPSEESLHLCFERCFGELPDESRVLLLQYYEGERSHKISNRRKLATALGLSDNALRSRVQRLRDRLERCVLACVALTTEAAR